MWKMKIMICVDDIVWIMNFENEMLCIWMMKITCYENFENDMLWKCFNLGT